MSMPEVYTAVTANIIHGSSSLEILIRRWGATGKTLPSWVPDYSATAVPAMPLPRELQLSHIFSDPCPSFPEFENLNSGKAALKVSTLVLDDIVQLYSITPFAKLDEVRRKNDRLSLLRSTALDGERSRLDVLSVNVDRLVSGALDERRNRLRRLEEEHEKRSRRAGTKKTDLLKEEEPFLSTIFGFACWLMRDDNTPNVFSDEENRAPPEERRRHAWSIITAFCNSNFVDHEEEATWTSMEGHREQLEASITSAEFGKPKDPHIVSAERERLASLKEQLELRPSALALFKTRSGIKGLGPSNMQNGDMLALIHDAPIVCILRETKILM